MKGRFLAMMKKWWMIAVVFALALSLTSCSRRNLQGLDNNGLAYCPPDPNQSYTLGSFDIHVIPVVGVANTYKVVVMPVTMDAPGDVITITAYTASNPAAYMTLRTEVTAYPEGRIDAGYLSSEELNLYDRLALTSYTPGVSFLEGNPAKDALCDLPLPGVQPN